MREKDNTLFTQLQAACDAHALMLEAKGENSFKISTDSASGLSLIVDLEESNFSFYYLIRTYDIIYHGDRSDVHVILALMFASFIRLVGDGISVSLFDIAHPVVEDEIWGRYIMPVQTPGILGASSIEEKYDKISILIFLMTTWREWFWTTLGCPCLNCQKKAGGDIYRKHEVPEEIESTIDQVFKYPKRSNYGNRTIPNWHYFYDIDHEVTIIKSKELATFLNLVVANSKRAPKKIKSLNGTLIIDGELKNYLSNSTKAKFDKIIKSLTKTKTKLYYDIIPMENMVIAVADDFVIALGRLSGIYEFKQHREKLKERHNQESELLFPIPSFVWELSPCPEQFEKLVKSLLEREPDVKSVRIPAPIKQGDKGRDLIIEWRVGNRNVMSERNPPKSLIKVVGQCKVSNAPVGKSKVIDIRDTVETHGSSGYFLAVSSQITVSITEKLESLRANGIWTDWWNREDIELRLSKNQDLIPLYPKVLKAAYTIKFIDNEE